MALYFECRINKNTQSDFFVGDFAHWGIGTPKIIIIGLKIENKMAFGFEREENLIQNGILHFV